MVQTRATKAQFNLNAGMEFPVSTTTDLRLGVFTDRSVVDQSYYKQSAALRGTAVTLPHVNRYGVSGALGLGSEPRACKCPETTTSIGLIFAYGVGTTPQLSEVFGAGAKETSVTTYTLTAVLSGSADL